MAIIKLTTTDAGASISYHRMVALKVDPATGSGLAHYQSYLDENAYILKKLVVWNWEIPVPSTALIAPLIASVESALVTLAASPFANGTIVGDATESLDAIKQRKLQQLSQSAGNQIVQGFMSSALGTPRLYPAKERDQLNLIGSIVESLIPTVPATFSTPFWCANAGVWAYENHTKAQVQQVGIDGKASTLAAMSKNATLSQQVIAATTKAAVEAIVW